MTEPETVDITCIDEAGNRHVVRGRAGLSLMEVLKEKNLLVGECGGGLACASCHVWLDPAQADRFDPPSEAEEDMLDVAFHLRETSRLSCQLMLTADADGLLIRLPHGAG
jgi:2Fe-2S ferredoxin